MSEMEGPAAMCVLDIMKKWLTKRRKNRKILHADLSQVNHYVVTNYPDEEGKKTLKRSLWPQSALPSQFKQHEQNWVFGYVNQGEI